MNAFPVVILAGGLATRLHPLTEKIPKSLVEVGGRPFIAHQLRLLERQGIRQVIISAWYKGGMIREFVGEGREFGLEVRYVFDGETPLGTGGAVRRALELLPDSFFVLYGDSYLPCDLAAIQAFFLRHSEPGLMTVHRNRGQWDKSNVELHNDRIIHYDKREPTPRMEFIDYGLGAFRAAVFAGLTDGQPADLAGIYQGLVAEGHLLAYEVPERFYEIGSFDGLRELDELLLRDPDHFLREARG